MQSATGATQHILNNRYKLIERIGSGGMASVYRAQDVVLGRTIAVKLLHPGLTGDETFLQKFQQEAQSVANLMHPNIVTVHDVGQDDNRYYIVMEFVEGQTLKQIVRGQPENRPMSINRALDLTIQTCSGLGYAHRSQLVHCDVKPQNILVTSDERVKVTDFGIARAMSQATQQNDELVWGTPQYFAPEQAKGEAPRPASDVYSLGIILFELLTNQLPFKGENHTAVALKHMHEAPPLVSDLNPLVPPQLEEIIQKVLSKEPTQRYQTAGQFGRILSTYRKQSMEDTGYTPAQRSVVGQTTQYYRRPEIEVASEPLPPITATMPENWDEDELEPVYVESDPLPAVQTDWLAVSLGIIAFFALLGLIPLWYLVYQAWLS